MDSKRRGGNNYDQEYPEQNLLNDLNPDTPIFRYMPIDRFFDMISMKEIVLCKPDIWDDPFENFLAKTRVIKNGQAVGFKLTDGFYAQCWTLKEKECDGFWRNYCSLSKGVRIETTAEKLVKAVWDDNDKYKALWYFVGKVQYMSEGQLKDEMQGCLKFGHGLTDTSGRGGPKTLLIKRLEFKWEEEVRVLAKDEAGTSDRKSFAINPVKFIDSIMFAPMMNSVRFKSYESCLGSRGFNSKFISRSKLYDPWTLTLP